MQTYRRVKILLMGTSTERTFGLVITFVLLSTFLIFFTRFECSSVDFGRLKISDRLRDTLQELKQDRRLDQFGD